jgi:hypothetical protein
MQNKWLVITGAFVVTLGLAAGAFAQSSSAATANAAKKINLEGCLRQQKAMGKMAQYVVTDPQVISASAGVSTAAKQVFTVAQVDESRLKELSDKWVQVLADVAGTAQAPELKVISIVQAEGYCPAPSNGGM